MRGGFPSPPDDAVSRVKFIKRKRRSHLGDLSITNILILRSMIFTGRVNESSAEAFAIPVNFAKTFTSEFSLFNPVNGGRNINACRMSSPGFAGIVSRATSTPSNVNRSSTLAAVLLSRSNLESFQRTGTPNDSPA